ncbi:hypothetical protein Kisp02_68030 [Kineosporia sp. NBRC 101731]|nr:hypothetical protein Kisp02_68030 [Kineosporia sp. NBRC 101731]
MTIAKLTAGDGYQYLMRDIAVLANDPRATPQPGQDVSAYYTAEGNPPGVWIGRGRHLLDLQPRAGQSARIVEAEHMQALFGSGLHPDAEARIAAYQRQHITPGMSPAEVEKVNADALRSVTLGRPFAAYKALPPFKERVHERLSQIIEETGRLPRPAEEKRIRAEEARRKHGSVAGYDLVFAPVKSAALLWALDERQWVQDAVIAAHHEAKDATLAMLEQHAAFTRTGTNGVAQIETKGLIGVSFDHWDSRDGDPNPHTHVAISNKVQGVDGIWRTLDGRALYRLTVAASEHYNTAFQVALTAKTGVRFEAKDMGRGKQPVYEIAGIAPALIKDFSRRRSALTARYDELTSAYRAEHGHDPSAAVAHKLARRANLDTRQEKQPPRSVAAMRATWTQQAITRHGPGTIRQVMAVVPDPERRSTAAGRQPVQAVSVQELAAQAVANVAQKRSTWTVWNVRAEAERLVKIAVAQQQPITGITASSDPEPEQSPLVISSLTEHQAAVTAVVKRAVSPSVSISIEAPALLAEPDSLQRSDGVSVFVQHAADRYTSQALLDAEQRLLHAASTPAADPANIPPQTRPDAVPTSGTSVAGTPSTAWVNATLDGFEAVHGRTLDTGQRALVTAFATDERLLSVGIGAAGTGKTTAMLAYLHTLTAQQRRLIPLATSAASASVLAGDLNTPAENVHKFLHEHLNGPHSRDLETGHTDHLPENVRQLSVRRGDVILVDEAGMAGTFTLDRITAIAAHHGATVRLIGDYRQLSAVESGGALRLIASEAGAVELSTLHRFRDQDEAAATLQIRTGDTTGLAFYESRDRIHGGSIQAMTDAAYSGWWTDVQAGKISVMTAASNADVTALSGRARADRVTAGQVEANGISLHDGNTAGAGDWIVTRHNSRRLATRQGRDFVRNGDAWRVLYRHDDGSLQVGHLEHGGQVRLPSAYVSQHVELLYASTVHRTQGSTVDTTHALISAGMLREHLYVALTRAAIASHLYVATHHLLPVDEDHRTDAAAHDPNARAAIEVLHGVLGMEGAERSATQAIREAQADSESLATLLPRYVHAVERATAAEHRRHLRDLLGQDAAGPLLNDPAWPDAARALHAATAAGWNAEHLLKVVTDDATWDHTVTVPSRPLGATSPSTTPAHSTVEMTAPTRAHVLADRITTLTAEHYSPAPLAQPTPQDVARYAHLIADITGITAASGRDLDPATALNRPADLGPFALIRRPEPVASRAAYSGLLGPAIGSRLAQQATREPAWPAVQAALSRLDDAGHDPAAVLRQVSNRNGLTGSRSISSVLAWRLGHYAHTHPATTPTAPETTTSATTTDTAAQAWPQLAWLLKAQENQGIDIHQILPTREQTTQPSAAPTTLTNLTTHVRRHATTSTQLTPTEPGLPPWTPAIPANDAYARAAADQLRARVAQLTDHAIATQPAWLQTLGTTPADPAQRDTWIQNVAVVAAFRDQHQITDDEPHRPLGPYLETTNPGHQAYWHAAHAAHQNSHPISDTVGPKAQSATSAPVAAGPSDQVRADTPITSAEGSPMPPIQPDPATVPSPARTLDAHLHHQIAVDTYRALPETERLAVGAGVTAKLGHLWFGPNISPDSQNPASTHPSGADPSALAGLDTALSSAVHGEQLHLVLQERGHLATPTQAPDTTTRAGALQRSRRTSAPRTERTRNPRRDTPATPSQTPQPRPNTAPAPLVLPAEPQRYRGPQPRL